MLITKLPPLSRIAGALLLGAGLVAGSQVHAHEAGSFLLKLGATTVQPKSDNGNVDVGVGTPVKLDVGSNTRPSISLTYMATPNIGIEVLGALPFKHGIRGSIPGLDLGSVGSTKHLPPTVSVQYHFLPTAKVQPYVGLGLNYTRFFSTKAAGALAGHELRLGDSWGLAGQVGVDVPLNKNWFVSADLRYIGISADVKLDGNKIGKAKIDPWTATLSVGYRF